MVYNIYNKWNGPINKEKKQKLKRFRTKYHALCDTNYSWEKEYKIWKQTGGLVGAIVTELISAMPVLIIAFS